MPETPRPLDVVDRFFAALITAAEEMAAQEQAARETRRLARKNNPTIRARRSAAAHAGWETRRTREAKEQALDAVDTSPVRTGPVCDEMNHNSIGGEVFCQLEPGHDDDHDDEAGVTWQRED